MDKQPVFCWKQLKPVESPSDWSHSLHHVSPGSNDFKIVFSKRAPVKRVLHHINWQAAWWGAIVQHHTGQRIETEQMATIT
jgi:hypothetical protein